MRLLTVTSLYPNAIQSERGLFVRERLRRLQQHHDVEATVVAPVPWFPFASPRFGEYSAFARVPPFETAVEGMILHPRYFHLPRVSDLFSPWSFAHAVLREIRRRRIRFDLIDAHFLFPDGVGAVLAARSLGRPVVLTARGSDVNLIAKERIAGKWISWSIRNADGLVAVSRDLSDELRRLADRDDVETIANGVDREQFRPNPEREAIRRRLGMRGFTVLSVGNLIDLKGHHLVIEALLQVAEARLVIAGEGPARAQLTQRVKALALEPRVHLLGSVRQSRLADYYCAADVLVLASSHEGMPNAILESLASGTPVVATSTGGAREVLANANAGRLCERNPDSIAEAIHSLRANMPTRTAVCATVDRFDWGVCADRIHELFGRLASGSTE